MKENYTVSIAKLSLEIDLKLGRLATIVVSRYPSVQSVSNLFIIKYFDQTKTGSHKKAHVLAVGRILEELKNHQAAVKPFMDRKTFDSIARSKMFLILEIYDIPPQVVNAIQIMHDNTSVHVMIPEEETESSFQEPLIIYKVTRLESFIMRVIQ
eukprot:TCONS_00015796-protein